MTQEPFVPQADPISTEQLRTLHPRQIADAAQIRAILLQVASEGIQLQRGVNRQLERELAKLEEVGDDRLLLRPSNFDEGCQTFLLSFLLGGRPYSFATNATEHSVRRGVVSASFPEVLYCGERRERLRRSHDRRQDNSWQVRVLGAHGTEIGLVEDSSPGGLGVRLRPSVPFAKGHEIELQYMAGPEQGSLVRGLVRHQSPLKDGWIHVGVQISPPTQDLIQPTVAAPRNRMQTTVGQAGAAARLLAARAARRIRLAPATAPEINVVTFPGGDRATIVGIMDSCGEPQGAPAVIIPPPWGRTKETLLPLARNIVTMFERANRAITVLRFDGTRRKGESYNEASLRRPGKEHHAFTFSHAVRDIEAGVDFLCTTVGASKVVLVTYSIAAIEGRRAVARNLNGRICGWVSLVGPSDLQSTVQSVSGGIDYLGGAERGLRFGIREILGIEVDIDLTSRDALDQGIGFLSDSCDDFEKIDVPVTWIHGAYDGWMDLDRVRKALSSGSSDRRRLLIVPSGHQLRSSRAALAIFSQVAEEVGKIVGGSEFVAPTADLVDIEARHRAERSRRPSVPVDVRSFWRRYLLGREGRAGMALMVETPIYQNLMAMQVEALAVQAGHTVADLGSGLGTLWSSICGRDPNGSGIRVVEVDLVAEALRAKKANRADRSPGPLRVVADLDGSVAGAVPLADRCCDRVLASLLISYLPRPALLLSDALRVLRPGGRIVVSTLRRDADFSKIWGDNAAVLRRAGSLSGLGTRGLEASLDGFFNDAARVLELEEAGLFEFYEPEELQQMLVQAGFEDVQTSLAFGDPPQAIVATGRRP